MNSDGIYQNEPMDSITGSSLEDEMISKCIPSVEISERSKDDWENFSSRMNILDDKSSGRLSKKSFLLFAKHYPNYHHYSYKVGLLTRYRKIPEAYAVLPEIKGHTLNHVDRENPNSRQIHDNISMQVNTLQDLTNSILRYGGKSDSVWMKFESSRNGQKLVRPGFSARRYMANLVRHLNDNLVEKLIADGKVLEKTIFQNSLILPHIRRRISADLSRYPEPYRILKQMLISPGPLNEYSFIWKRPNYLSEEISFDKVSEMNKGDIKILSKKNVGDNTEIYEEVQYVKMSHEKKKTILSNLLLKSAVNHALKMKEEIIEHNSQTTDKTTKENVHNIHIPIINFDMMEAVTDLLNKETLEMLSSSVVPSIGAGGFKGQALRVNTIKTAPHIDSNEKLITENNEDLQRISIDHLNNDANFKTIQTVNFIPNLTLRLNPTNVNRSNNKKKIPKTENHSGRQSSLSNSHNAVISFDPSNFGLPDYQSQQEAQSNAFVERLKNKVARSGVSHEKKLPYGKYKDTEEPCNDPDLNPVGDIDPTSSFNNWKYDDTKHTNSEFGKGFDSSSLSSSGNFPSNSLFNSKFTRKISKGKLSDQDSKVDETQYGDFNAQDNHNRLIQLLSEHAETVAEKVLKNSGGEDFASDVNDAVIQWNEILKERYFELFSYVAIMEILMQKKALINQANNSNGQIWNLDVQDLKNEDEYSGMIKNIFKSLFKEQLGGVTNDDVNISLEIMALLQDGSKLALDNIEVQTDPITGKTVIKLKDGISIKPKSGSLVQQNSVKAISRNLNYSQMINIENSETVSSFSELQKISQIPSSISPIVIESAWDGSSLSIDIKKSTSYIIEEKIDSELVQSKISIPSQSSAELNNKLKQPSGIDDAQIISSTLSHQPIPSTKSGNARLSEDMQRSSGENNLAVSHAESSFKKTGSNVEYIQDKSITSSVSPKAISKQSKQEFIIGRIDDTKDVMSLYSQSPEKLGKVKIQKPPSQKQLGKATKQKLLASKKPKQENPKSKKKPGNITIKDNQKAPLEIKSEIINKVEVTEQPKESQTLIEKEDNESIHLEHESSSHTIESVSKLSPDFISENYEDKDVDQVDDEDVSGDDEEDKEKKLLMRQKREAKRKADAEKRRLEVDRKRKEKEEQRKLENKKRELEENMTKKLEEERRQREEEFRLKQEKEKDEELLRIEALKHQEYLRLKQIEKERREKEEFNRRLEEMKLLQALEDQKRKLEQERLVFEESERIRIENEMISRMRESERIQYLKNKAEEEERKRLKEEEEKRLKEEQVRLALEEAQRIAQQQARERAILEARLNFMKGLKIENEGLKKFLNITPTFVWSYFEFLKILGLQPNPTTNKLEADNKLTG